MDLRGTLLFHLNLSYSSIEVEERRALVERCYWPILRLAEGRPWLRLAIEATGHTLERIRDLDPTWIAELRRLVEAGSVEFVGSGDTQLIGPLVPEPVGTWNQRLGAETYAELLGERPQTALVNEMAWSQGIVDGYVEAGYRTLLMEWNNPRRIHPEWDNEWRYQRARTASPTGAGIDVLFVDAIAFQKFQRATVGDLEIDEYVDWVLTHASDEPRHLFLYASDAEVFDFRPGRYTSEPALPSGDGASEWPRIGAILDALFARGVTFTTPDGYRPERELPEVTLSSFADPIPVKKQPKYNVTRWALSGRDDVGLNRMCFDRARLLTALEAQRPESVGPEDWRELCRAWASDHRTHITPSRWSALDRLATDPPKNGFPVPLLARSEVERLGRRILVRTGGVEVLLDPRRGLAIERFARSAGSTLLGTLPHGYFDDIHWAADFYSGHTVVEVPAQMRATDLESVEAEIDVTPSWVDVTATVETLLGPLEKRVRVKEDRVELTYGFSAWSQRPVGSLRTAIATLDPNTFGGDDVAVRCANGGAPETFPVDGSCQHTFGVSALVSARGAFGATDGRFEVLSANDGVEFRWDPSRAAALPLVMHREIDGRRMLRVAFSLSEVDDTHREGAPLYDFKMTLLPRTIGTRP